MIIVLKKDEAKEKIEVVKKAFDGKKQVFVHENRVAVQGAKADEIPSEVLNAAEDVITNVPAAVQSSRLLHPEDLLHRGPDKHVVEQQGTPRVDQLAVHLPHLHVRGGEILEQRLPATLATGKLGIQPS